MARMFGTDGVRGVAGTELTIELAMKLGQAGAYVLVGLSCTDRFITMQDSSQKELMLLK